MSLFEGAEFALPPKSCRTVLIIGSGPLASAAARAVIDAGGDPVLLETAGGGVGRTGRVEPGNLISLTGLPGYFTAVIGANRKRRPLPVGAVILAFEPEPAAAPPAELAGLPEERIIRLDRAGPPAPGRTGLFFGFWDQPGPGRFGRFLDAARSIIQAGGRPFLFFPQSKVAGPGLEEKYRDLRRAGALVIRTERPPVIEKEGGRLRLRYFDSAAGDEVVLTVDRLVYDPPLVPSASAEKVAERLGLSPGPDGFSVPNNLHYPPPLTSRAGVFAIGGPSRPEGLGLKDESALLSEHLRRFFEPPAGSHRATRLASHKGQCAECLTCLRICPVGAIAWQAGPVVLEDVCLDCGQCAAGCPRSIIKPLRAGEALGRTEAGAGKGSLVLACERLGPETLAGLPEGVRVARLNCLARVSVDLILRLLNEGQGRIIVAACHKGNCRSRTGTTAAAQVIDDVRSFLVEIGSDPDRVRLVNLAPHQAGRLRAAVDPD